MADSSVNLPAGNSVSTAGNNSNVNLPSVGTNVKTSNSSVQVSSPAGNATAGHSSGSQSLMMSNSFIANVIMWVAW